MRRIFKTFWGLSVVIAFCASLLTAGAMALSAGIFGLVSSVVEAVTDGRSLRQSQASYVAEMQDEYRLQLDDRERRIAAQGDEIGTLRRTVAQQADEIAALNAERYVTINGERRLLREVVTETSTEVTEIAARSAARNIASMPGEGIPVIGIAVVVAATGWEIKDACSMSTAMYDLDVAMNPDHEIENAVCGMDVPTAAEVWQTILDSPADVWALMVQEYEELPTLSEAWLWVVDVLKTTPRQIWELLSWAWSLIVSVDWPGWDDINPFGGGDP